MPRPARSTTDRSPAARAVDTVTGDGRHFIADAYARHIAAIVAPWVPGLVAAADVRPADRVLDLACGPGIVTGALADRLGPTGSLAAFDVSEEMLAEGRERVRPSLVTVEWRQGSALRLPFESASFDRVACQQGLQFFSSAAGALAEARRVLVPGGRLVATVWRSLAEVPFFDAITEGLSLRLPREEVARLTAVATSLADADELAVLVRAAGFASVDVTVETRFVPLPPADAYVPAYLGATAWAGSFAGLPPRDRAAVVSEVAARLSRWAAPDGLAVPFAANVVVAKA